MSRESVSKLEVSSDSALSSWLPRLLESGYVDVSDRFVVALLVTFSEPDFFDIDGARLYYATAEGAAAAALDLTRDMGKAETQWHVLDLETGQSHRLEQGEFEAESVEFSRPVDRWATGSR